jgi:hypothetical protein
LRGWDFTLTFNPILSLNLPAAVRPPEAGQPGDSSATASDPSGGYSIFDAIEKARSEARKREKVRVHHVIDHIEQMPAKD